MRVLKHVLAVFLALFLALGLPFLRYADLNAIFSGGADAVTRATTDLPDTPSGDFVVFINREKHPDSLDQWRTFFAEGDYGVLLEDVHCMVISGDAAGQQLAQRYQARLVKDQMTLHSENGVLAASRLDNGLYDMVILSREMAQVWQLADCTPPGAVVVEIQEDVS